MAETVGYLIGLGICYLAGYWFTEWINKKWSLNINSYLQGAIYMLTGVFLGPCITAAWAYFKFNQNK